MRLFFAAVVSICTASASAQTICIDPGHPSENGIGTKGKKTTEVNVAWEVALKLKQVLSGKGYKVVLTKGSEREKVTNQKRAQIGNDAKSDLVVRLHCDAGTGHGTAVYYPAKAGKVRGVTGPTHDVLSKSKAAAAKFHPAYVKALKGELRDNGLMTDGRTLIGGRQGALTGSIFSKVPVLLVEMCVLQNAKDEKFIAAEAGKMKMAQALASGVEAAVPIRRKSN